MLPEVFIYLSLLCFMLFLVLGMIFRRRTTSSYLEALNSTKRELILEEAIDSLSREKEVLHHKNIEVEGQVREITRLNEYILKSIDYAVISTDLENRIKSVNPYFSKCFQVSFREVSSVSLEQFFQKQPDLVKRFEQMRQKKASSSFRMQFSYRKPSLVLQWFDISATKLRDNYNNDIGYVVLLRDITQLKNMESQLVLKQEMEVLGEMSATLAHEFRNALNPIKGNARLLSKQVQDQEVLETVQNIQSSIEQLNDLVDKLLGYARSQPLELKDTDLKEVVDSASVEVSKALTAKNLYVSIKYHGDSFPLQGDPILLKQAFSNLLWNALDAVNADTGEISVEVSCVAPYYQLIFRDNGLGIPQEIRNKIFRPFFTTKAQGTGLGLAFTRKIIVSHGGTIQLNSPPEGGCQFIIQLPFLSQDF